MRRFVLILFGLILSIHSSFAMELKPSSFKPLKSCVAAVQSLSKLKERLILKQSRPRLGWPLWDDNILLRTFPRALRYRPEEKRSADIFDRMHQLHDDQRAQWDFLLKITNELDKTYIRSGQKIDRRGKFRRSIEYRQIFRAYVEKRLSLLGIQLVDIEDFISTYVPERLSMSWEVGRGEFPHLGPVLKNALVFAEINGKSNFNPDHFEYLHPVQIIFYGERVDQEFGNRTFLQTYQDMARKTYNRWGDPSFDFSEEAKRGFLYYHWYLFFDSRISPFSGTYKIFHKFKFLSSDLK